MARVECSHTVAGAKRSKSRFSEATKSPRSQSVAANGVTHPSAASPADRAKQRKAVSSAGGRGAARARRSILVSKLPLARFAFLTASVALRAPVSAQRAKAVRGTRVNWSSLFKLPVRRCPADPRRGPENVGAKARKRRDILVLSNGCAEALVPTGAPASPARAAGQADAVTVAPGVAEADFDCGKKSPARGCAGSGARLPGETGPRSVSW